MKKCPSCQTTYEDSLRFCQTDGTALIEIVAEKKEATDDPFKTMIAGSRPQHSDDILDLPDKRDSSARGTGGERGPTRNFPVTSPPPELPKFSEPSLSQPNFGDLTPQKPTSPFDSPSSIGKSTEPFSQSSYATPVERLSPPSFQAPEWTPPPAPVASWQDQGLGSQTPFAPPMAQGQNQTMAVVALILGILSIVCCQITGPVAIVVGYLARQKAEMNPSEFGGSGLALAGMITGIVGTVLLVLVIIYYIFMVMVMAGGGMMNNF